MQMLALKDIHMTYGKGEVQTLSHYAITTMLAERIREQMVAEIAEHASADFPERTYRHPQMESRMLAAERLSNALFPSQY